MKKTNSLYVSSPVNALVKGILREDKTTKILLGAIALGLFLNASNVFIDKAFANQVQKVAICHEKGYRCSDVWQRANKDGSLGDVYLNVDTYK